MKMLIPESALPGKSYSFLSDLRQNLWAFLALAMSLAGRVILSNHPEWAQGARAAIALLPLVPLVLYSITIARWIRRLDEMQRSIHVEAGFIAALETIGIMTAMSVLESCRVLRTHGLGWEGAFACFCLLYFLHTAISNRRFA